MFNLDLVIHTMADRYNPNQLMKISRFRFQPERTKTTSSYPKMCCVHKQIYASVVIDRGNMR